MGAHDALFKHVFSVPEHAAAELAHVLPASVSAEIDWSTLRLEPGSFVDEGLEQRHTDLLFSVNLDGRTAYVYLLFEHQSDPHARMPLRIAGYVVKILDGVCARSADSVLLPVVIPIVLHHERGGWSRPVTMRELYAADTALLDALGERVLALRFIVDDLSSQSTNAIMSRAAPPLVRLVLGLLRDARDDSLETLFLRWGVLMIETARAVGLGALTAVLQYLQVVRKIEDRRVLIEAAHDHGGVELEEVVMLALDKLRAEGIAEGIVLGKAEGKAEVLLRQLRLRFGEVAPSLAERVRAASTNELDAMIDRILTAPNAIEVVG